MSTESRDLFHQLNNQLGIVLAHAEILESKAATPAERTRAERVVASTLEALQTARALQHQLEG